VPHVRPHAERRHVRVRRRRPQRAGARCRDPPADTPCLPGTTSPAFRPFGAESPVQAALTRSKGGWPWPRTSVCASFARRADAGLLAEGASQRAPRLGQDRSGKQTGWHGEKSLPDECFKKRGVVLSTAPTLPRQAPADRLQTGYCVGEHHVEMPSSSASRADHKCRSRPRPSGQPTLGSSAGSAPAAGTLLGDPSFQLSSSSMRAGFVWPTHTPAQRLARGVRACGGRSDPNQDRCQGDSPWSSSLTPTGLHLQLSGRKRARCGPVECGIPERHRQRSKSATVWVGVAWGGRNEQRTTNNALRTLIW
jgi:hypothetical protein